MREALRLFLCGLCIGTADLIPGISGGTVALILGVYEPLLTLLSSLPLVFRQLLAGNFKHAHHLFAWHFALPLMAGIIVALVSLVHLLQWLLTSSLYKVPLSALFAGLVIGSTLFLIRTVKSWRFSVVLVGVLAIAITQLFFALPSSHISISLGWLFISGMISICATLLPGISGSYCLHLLGVYPTAIAALASLSAFVAGGPFSPDALAQLVALASGASLSAVFFSRLIFWTLQHYHDMTMAIMIGIIVGSLDQVWPFQGVSITESVDWISILLLSLGIFCVVVIDCYRPGSHHQPLGG